jgi:CubicO group peptidase (beta-lactamase class C family)
MMRQRMLVVFVVSVLGGRTLEAQALSPAMASGIDSIFARYAPPGGPGCAVGVYQNGTTTFARGYGLANITNDVPITPITRFTTGSVSKQFTAASIALLVRAGKLSLDDDVRKYVPELVDYGTPIKIRHLVHHTSGLRDFWELVDLAGMRPDDGYTVDDMLALAAKQKGLDAPPGSQYRYSNTGYLVMGVVVKRVTGQSLRQFADSAIFKPLGMTETLFLDDHNEIVPRRAMAYSPSGKTWKINVWNNDLVGQGGIVTSLADLQKWDENFYSGQVGGKEFVELMQTTEQLSGGGTNDYAFGLTVQSYRGQRLVEHTGATGGYRAAILRFPAQHTSVAMMCNVSTANTTALALGMADVVLDAQLAKADALVAARRAGRSMATLNVHADMSGLAGRYVSSELNDAIWQVLAGADSSRLEIRSTRHEPMVLVATGPREFSTQDGSVRVRFDQAENGRAPGFRVFGSRASGLRFTRIAL